MGKTVTAYRWVLEDEIVDWKGFRKALSSDEDRDAFVELMDMCGNNAMAAGNACNPIIFETMVMLASTISQNATSISIVYSHNQLLFNMNLQ